MMYMMYEHGQCPLPRGMSPAARSPPSRVLPGPIPYGPSGGSRGRAEPPPPPLPGTESRAAAGGSGAEAEATPSRPRSRGVELSSRTQPSLRPSSWAGFASALPRIRRLASSQQRSPQEDRRQQRGEVARPRYASLSLPAQAEPARVLPPATRQGSPRATALCRDLAVL